MDVKANAPMLEASSNRLLNALFYERIASLEQVSSMRLVLSKQMQIKQLKDRLLTFIREHRYSFFEVAVLTNESDIEKPLLSIKVRNFPAYIDDIKPNEYLIAIEPTWTDCQIFQLSSSGLKVKEIII